MSFPQKRSRRIHVNGHDLLWCVGRLEYHGLSVGDRVYVQSASGKGSKLVVTLPWDWCDEPEVAPRHIAAWVKAALQSGWQPEESSPQCELQGFAVS